MIATANPVPARQWLRGVNVVRRRDGSEVHLDHIVTADAGQALLDEVDATILSIESQLDHIDGRDANWRSRAEIALKKNRRIRPALQRRIGDLRRAERDNVRTAGSTPIRSARLVRAELRRAS